jgi:shikimate dehydrogenase
MISNLIWVIKSKGKEYFYWGLGGATRGALLPLLEKHPLELVVANRTFLKAKKLGDQLPQFNNLLIKTYPELVDQSFDIIINATSASLRGELPPLTPEIFSSESLAYDLVYGKGLTPFLELARSVGVKGLADGVGMLAEQAAEAFFWWRGVRPETRSLIAQLTVPLA